MRRPWMAVVVAAAILAAATAGGILIAALSGSSGSSSDSAQAAGGASGPPPDMSSLFATALDPLVQAGTLSGDQESAVIEALSATTPGGDQGGQLGPGATPPSGQTPGAGATPPSGGRQGSMPDPSRLFESTLDGLVSDGTITSSQETAVIEALASALQQAGPGQRQTSAGAAQSG